jgi:DNA topoisomerase 2-associated protein PAT1
MAFFGFDTTLPQDKPGPSSSRGIFEQHDPFGGFSRGEGDDDGEMLDFEQTYDGLGQQLQESGDAFNDDTFGGDGPVTREAVGKDFDFAGQTAKIRGELLEEQALHHARQPLQYSQAAKPKKTGYEAYREPEYIPKLEADASIWGKPMGKKSAEQHARQDSTAGKKMMSLEEVEAMMRAQSRPTPPAVPDIDKQSQGLRDMLGVGAPAPAPAPQEQPRPVQILQRPHPPPQDPQIQQPIPEHQLRAPQILQRQHSPQHAPRPQSQDFHGQPPYPTPAQHATQMPMGAPAVQPPHARAPMQQVSHNRGPSYNGPPITQAQQMMSMSPDEREAYLAEEAKRAKRNHKIFLLSKNNGLMTPQDKNFITRIQLQQLLTATGGIDNELGSEEQIAEDFYYQVYAQIRGPPRSGPGQPLNQFAQTYLFQTGSRYGYGRSRHHPKGGDNHVQRMEQQVARAVEAAKARPKNKSLVVEGSLGKIAFSNSKTPRPLLNIKRPDSENKMRGPAKPATVADRKAALRDIESLYSTLMKLEDHERKLPPPPNEDSPPDVTEGHMRWRTEMQELNRQLWEASKVMESPPTEFVAIPGSEASC